MACAILAASLVLSSLHATETAVAPASASEEASLERASLLISTGHANEAEAFLSSQAFHGRETRAAATYLRGVAFWKQGKTAEAGKIFSSVQPATPWLAAASSLGCVLADTEQPGTARGIRVLEKQISKGAAPGIMAGQFRLLDKLYAAAGVPDTTVLDSWAADASDPARARLARFYRAKGDLRLGRTAQGEAGLTAFLKDEPEDAMAAHARIMLALSQLGRGSLSEAVETAHDHPSNSSPERARAAYLRGLADAAAGHTTEATADFSLAASLDPTLAGDALFNKAILTALAGRGSLEHSEDARAIVESGGAAGEEMDLQIALDKARRGDADAAVLLRSVAERCKDPAVRSRARVAAAELDMASGKGDSAVADFSKALREGSPQPEREEYLKIFLYGNGGGSGLVSACRSFLESHPTSPFAPDVRLRLAEALLSSGDLQGARAEFELLAATAPEGDLARDSLFLAARSASGAMDPGSIDDSLMLLERVAGKATPDRLTWQARLQEGALKIAQGLPSEALAIYDRILASAGSDPELRSATLMAKGDTHHQMGKADPVAERSAVESWRRLAEDPSLPVELRIQALCKAGLVLENLGETESALACFDEAFRIPARDRASGIWHDKAAFEAAHLLEKGRRWNEAVALYDALMAGGGERSGEARARLSKLRLENFLWDN